MPVKTLKLVSALILALSAAVYSQYNPLYYSSLPKVSAPYDTILQKTWEGVKRRNVDAYPLSGGLIHRPKSETPGDAVSEGVSYGMYLALYANDQASFNRMWEAGDRHMGVSGTGGGYHYDWRVNANSAGTAIVKTGTGAASDADQDIALLLIFANELAKAGIWQPYSGSGTRASVTYESRARQFLQTIRGRMIDGHFGYLLPGFWGESNGSANGGTVNPGYFAPAFYRVFAEFDSANASVWNALIDTSYAHIRRSPGYARGLLPDWTRVNGSSTGGAGYNAYFRGDAMYRDAIRVYWRLAKDYLWYGEPRAKAFLDNAMAFIEDTLKNRSGAYGPDAVDYFQMNGNPLPENDIERLAGGTIIRSRREQSPLTAGMWAAAAIGTGNIELAEKYSDKLLEFYTPGADYWGNAADPTGGRYIGVGSMIDTARNGTGQIPFTVNANVPEDTLRNEMYFEQFLAWFGAALLGGITTNVWADLKDGVPTGPPAWVNRPKAILDGWDINASVKPFTLGAADASFNRSMPWTVTFTHQTAGDTKVFSGTSNAVNVTWYGLNDNGGYMTQGWYTVTISVPGLSPENTYIREVWLGRPYSNIPNLRAGNRLLIDDFNDGDLVPYIGAEWRTYTEGNGSTGTFSFGSQGNNRWMIWDYAIGTGSYPLSALVWSAGTNTTIDFSGVDSIIIVARTASGTLGTSLQLLSTDFAPNEWQYFGHSVQLTSSWQTIGMAIANFRQRGDGSGKNINTSLANLTGMRFHMQTDLPEAPPAAGTVQLDAVYISGPDNVLSRIYTPPPAPPEYTAPNRDPIVVSVTHRAVRKSDRYSVKRTATQFILTMPADMAGADARIINVKGAVVRRAAVPRSGQLTISTRDLPAGMYFVDVKKAGMAGIRAPLGNVK